MILSWLLISYITMAYIRNQILYQPKLNSNCFSMVMFLYCQIKLNQGKRRVYVISGEIHDDTDGLFMLNVSSNARSFQT